MIRFLAIVVALTSSITSASALSCFVIRPEFPQAFESADAVFIGEVVKISEPINADADAPLAYRMYKVTFKVEYSWKGAGFQQFGLPELEVLSNQGKTAGCSSRATFREGAKYLVYAEKTVSDNLIVQAGDRTTLVSNADDDLSRLRMMNPFFRVRGTPLFYSFGDLFQQP